jgi:O-antigen/teichoic acid export membrane protein
MNEGGRKRKFLGGLGLGYLNTALYVLVGLWLTPFLLNRLGEDQYGLWLLGVQILMYLGLMDLGVVAILPRYVAYATGRAGSYSDARDLPDLVGHTARLVLWQTPVVAVAAIVAWRLVPSNWAALQWPLALVVATFVVLFPSRVFHGVLQGLQDLPFLGAAQMWAWMVGTAVTVLLVWRGWGLYALAVGWMTTQGLSVMLFGWRLWHRFPEAVPARLPAPAPARAREHLGKGLWVSATQVAQVLLNGTDIMILGRLLGPSAVVPFVCTGKLISLLANQPQLLMQTASPALSELRAGAARAHLFAVSTALSQAMLLGSGAVACVVLAVNHGFVAWWVGSVRFGGGVLTLLMLAAMLLRHLNLTAVYTLFCFGHERRLAITSVADGAATLAASLVLVRMLGAPGVVVGSIVGVVAVSLPNNLAALALENGVGITTVLAPLAPWFWRFCLLALGAAGMSAFWVPTSFWLLALDGAIVGSVYVAVMIPLLARPPLGGYIMPRLMSILAKVSRAFGRPLTGESAG